MRLPVRNKLHPPLPQTHTHSHTPLKEEGQAERARCRQPSIITTVLLAPCDKVISWRRWRKLPPGATGTDAGTHILGHLSGGCGAQNSCRVQEPAV